uniref:outer membrane beta-barrel protein n=1 Tax=Mariniflexile sp. TaxID=1979402 RepID=UPI00404821FA
IQRGNPNLNPQDIYNYGLSYTHKNKYFINYNYVHVKSAFFQVTSQEANTVIQSYENVGERFAHSFIFNYQKASLFKWWAFG